MKLRCKSYDNLLRTLAICVFFLILWLVILLHLMSISRCLALTSLRTYPSNSSYFTGTDVVCLYFSRIYQTREIANQQNHSSTNSWKITEESEEKVIVNVLM